MNTQFKIGDRVIVNPEIDVKGKFTGIVYEVERIKPVNILLKPVSGNRDRTGYANERKLNCRPEYLLPASDAPQTSSESVVGQPYVPYLWAGQVVTVMSSHHKWTYTRDQRFVVLGQTTPDRVKIAKLGGDEGRTWTMPRHAVTVVES